MQEIAQLKHELAQMRSQIERLTRTCQNLLVSHIQLTQKLNQILDKEPESPVTFSSNTDTD